MSDIQPTGETVIFIRDEGFYPIQLMGLRPVAEEVVDHVALNPGTLRVEDMRGNVIWHQGQGSEGPTTPEQAIKDMQALGNAFGTAVSEALHEGVTSTKAVLPNVPDAVVLAAAVNGGVMGALQFMSDMADAGRMPDPDAKLALLFELAADLWTQMRGGPAGAEATVQ